MGQVLFWVIFNVVILGLLAFHICRFNSYFYPHRDVQADSLAERGVFGEDNIGGCTLKGERS